MIQLQYYYKDNKCKAKYSKDSDCICWHDEGSNPLKDARNYQPSNDQMFKVGWRVKPDNQRG